MIRIPCPWCGPRNATEFHHRGEANPRPDASAADEESWRRYLYFRRNSNGWVDESWYHAAGCRRVISLRRNTTTNEIAPGGTE